MMKLKNKSLLALLLAVVMVCGVIAPSLTRGEDVVPEATTESVTEADTEAQSDEIVVETTSPAEEETPAETESEIPVYGTHYEYTKKAVDEYGNEYNEYVVSADCEEISKIPDTAVLHVDEMLLGSREFQDAYDAVLDELNLAEDESLAYVPYDIYFTDEDGNRIEPQDGVVKIAVQFHDAPIEETEGTEVSSAFVAHVNVDGKVELLENKVYEERNIVVDEINPLETEFVFEVNGFSPMGPAQVLKFVPEETQEETVEETTPIEESIEEVVDEVIETAEETIPEETRTVETPEGNTEESAESPSTEGETTVPTETVPEQTQPEETQPAETETVGQAEDPDAPGTYIDAMINGQAVKVRVMEHARDTYDFGDNTEIIRQDTEVIDALEAYLGDRALYSIYDITGIDDPTLVYHVVLKGVTLGENATLIHLNDGWQNDESKIQELEFLYNAENQTVSFNTGSFSPFAFVEKADEAEEPTEPVAPEEPQADLSGADVAINRSLSAVGLHGKLVEDMNAAVNAVDEELNAESADDSIFNANEMVAKVFAEVMRGDTKDGEDVLPTSADGTSVDNFGLSWVTKDTEDNGDASLLYIKPKDDNAQNVRARINYGLSGMTNYEPGTIVITIPASMFEDRNGNAYGTINIPYPEDPSTKNDFNWKRVGDTYVLTNAKTIAASTKGYIEIGFYNLIPHMLVDMAESNPFWAKIEVLTSESNLIGMQTGEITAQFDTEAKLNSATKRQYSAVTIVGANEVPESQRIEGEDYYAKATWYMWGERSGNTSYTIAIEDQLPNEFGGFLAADKSDPWVLTTNDDGSYSYTNENFYHGTAKQGQTSYVHMTSYYPLSSFTEGETYTFHNKMIMTLTEDDPAVGDDPQLVTEKEVNASVTWTYHLPRWKDASGHFNMLKNGTDGKAGNNQTHRQVTSSSVYSYSDLRLPQLGYFGIYNSGLNHLRDGEDFDISYMLNSVAYLMPWTYEPVDPNEPNAIRMVSNYFRHSFEITSTEEGLSFVRNRTDMVEGVDYDYKSVEFASFTLYDGVPHNIDESGNFTSITAGDGTFLYSTDNDLTRRPDVQLEVLMNGEWTHWATVSWQSGAMVITCDGGESYVDGITVTLPEGTENVRTRMVTNRAGVQMDMRVNVTLHPTESLVAAIESAFEQTMTPALVVWDTANINIDYAADDALAGQHLFEISNQGYDSVRGYTTDLSIYPEKKGTWRIEDVDYADRTALVNYKTDIEIRSFLADRTTYVNAIADGTLPSDHHGFFYDLLPKGMTPVMNSIKLRSGDTILDAYTVENYKNSGRTLLVVEANLTPIVATYRSGGVDYYEDKLTMTFKALYGFDAMVDYGNEVHNVIAFESDRDKVGTVANYGGEKGDLSTNNNVATARAFDNDNERTWMTNLDPNSGDKENFIFTGCYTLIDIESAARVSLMKDVQTNYDGVWSQGIGTDDNRTVYTGGVYQYRLRMMPDTSSQASDMILYDSLENYVPSADQEEAGATWKGEFAGVDVSQLVDAGALPVVYYSTTANLSFETGRDPLVPNSDNIDLTSSIWVKASDYTGDLKDVKAIAVDASKKADGTDFVLEPLQSGVVIINMRAPAGEDASALAAQGAHAYNNVYLNCSITDVETSVTARNQFLNRDYTKVGLTAYKIEVKKVWNDDDNRDGLRPETLTFHLFANGEDTGKTVTINVAETDTGVFEDIPYADETGQKIRYSVKEDAVEGYTSEVSAVSDAEGVIATNTHEPERIVVNGEKKWVGDTPETRPSYITVMLYANGDFITQKTVRSDANGAWTYSFENLYKYKDGEEIVYTVEERLPNGYSRSYIAGKEEGTYNLVNTYYPYGQLIVTKTTQDTTPAGDDAEFTFNFRFIIGSGEDAVPVLEGMPYEIIVQDESVTEPWDEDVVEVHNICNGCGQDFGSNVPADAHSQMHIENGEDGGYTATDVVVTTIHHEAGEKVIAEGTVACDESITIKADQMIRINRVPQNTNYTVTEEEVPGFTAQRASYSGQIVASGTSRADFVNKYLAKGDLELGAEKTLYNRTMNAYQFHFELFEVVDKAVEGEEGEEPTSELDINSLKSAYNNTAKEVVYLDGGTEGPVDYSVADIVFGRLSFTQKDVGDHTYFVREVFEPEFIDPYDWQGGYIYDQTIYKVDVHVEDNGDGTLTIDYELSQFIPAKDAAEPEPTPSDDLITDDAGASTKAYADTDHEYDGDVPIYDLVGVAPAYVPFELADLLAEDATFEPVEEMTFENSYYAMGTVQMRAWKNVHGYPGQPECWDCWGPVNVAKAGNNMLKNVKNATDSLRGGDTSAGTMRPGQFEFVLLDENGDIYHRDPFPWEVDEYGDDIPEEYLELHAWNDGNGNVFFDKLYFTQADIGKTYHFGVKEIPGTDVTMNYDDSIFGYEVTIRDRGNGELVCTLGFAEPVMSEVDCPYCNGTGAAPNGSVADITPDNMQGVDVLNIPVVDTSLEIANPSVDIDNPFRRYDDSRNRVGAEWHETGYMMPYLNGDWGTSIGLTLLKDRVAELGTKTTSTMTEEVYNPETGDYEEVELEYVSRMEFVGSDAQINQAAQTFIYEWTRRDWRFNSTDYWGNYGDKPSSAQYDYFRMAVDPGFSEGVSRVVIWTTPHEEELLKSSSKVAEVIVYRGSLDVHVRIEPVCSHCHGTGHVLEITDWVSKDENVPIFINTYKPGTLSVSKSLYDSAGDPTTEFRFKVVLIGPDVTDDLFDHYRIYEGENSGPKEVG